jgi:hypothetical protein
MDRLLTGDIDVISDAEIMAGEKFDLILIGDLLSQLPDTDAVLAKARRLMTPEGILAFCVPNIGHWSSFFHLFHGGWPAEDAGLFDRAHLRFFTGASIRAALERNGFRPLKQRPRQALLDQARAEKWRPALADFAEQMGIDRRAFLEQSATLQHVLVAGLADAPAPRPMHIVVAAMAPQVMDARARLPALHMRGAPDVNVTYHEKNVALPILPAGTAKILIVQRAAPHTRDRWKDLVGPAIKQGWLVVTEYDDHPELIGQVLNWAPERERWLQIEAAHAVQTSTEPLAAAFRERADEVKAFANAAFTLPPLAPRTEGPMRVFHGALNRGDYSVAIAHALAPAIESHPDISFEVLHDQRFFEALPTDRKTFQPVLGYDAYLNMIGQCDIALLPLAGDPLELYKSDIKYVEAASRGAAMIASPAIYRETIEDSRTGLIVETPEGWGHALRRLLEDKPLREAMVRSAWEDVRDRRMFSAQLPARLKWYRELWDRREALQEALLARCPWIASN